MDGRDEIPIFEGPMSRSEELGNQIATYSYASSVGRRIRSLVNDIRNRNSKQLISQKIPRSMRRRAVSHDPRRLPRKYRMIFIKQSTKSGTPSKRKRPSRKYRRRPRCLLNEYLRRQRKNKWLETHIWHAKRFHMVNKWGYRLPYASCQKTFRACYRATTNYCLLQDLSFYSCIEITGPLGDIRNGFKRLTASPQCGLGITAKTYLSGCREGTIDLFGDGTYPYKALGRGFFIWKPILESENQMIGDEIERTLWLWIHPLGYTSILQEILNVFRVYPDRKSQKISIEDIKKQKANEIIPKSKEEVREEFMTKVSTRLNIPSYSNSYLLYEEETDKKPGIITVRELGGTLNRFRLTGPMAQNILSKVLHVADLKDDNVIKMWSNTWIGLAQDLQNVNINVNEARDDKSMDGKAKKEMESLSYTQKKGQQKSEMKDNPMNYEDKENTEAKDMLTKKRRRSNATQVSELQRKKVKLVMEGREGNEPSMRVEETDSTRLIDEQDTEAEEDQINQSEDNQFNSFLTSHQQQKCFWDTCSKSITSPGELLSNCVIALNIEDPRLHRPSKSSKKKVLGDVQGSQIDSQRENDSSNNTSSHSPFDLNSSYTNILPHSLLWEQRIRDCISKDFMQTYDYNYLRHKSVLVPGSQCQEEREKLQPIPIILIQRPGVTEMDYGRLSYGCGFDIIAPAGYGMPLWLSLLMWGCRPGGLRESESIQREAGYEFHLPDTVAGLHLSKERYFELYKRYFRLPPNRRPNYVKLGVMSPFRAQFQYLIRDWQEPSISKVKRPLNSKINFFVLRDRDQLRYLLNCFQEMRPINNNILISNRNCIVPVKVVLKHRGGSLKDFSMICLPERRDLIRYRRLRVLKLNEPVFVEPAAKDTKAAERLRLRFEHKRLLKRLRRQRLREKRLRMATSTVKVYIRPAKTRRLCAQHFVKMCKLWLQEDRMKSLYAVRKHGARDVLGFLTTTGYSFVQGTMTGVGYVSLNGLIRLHELSQTMPLNEAVLMVRSTNSSIFRFAKFDINVEP